MNYTIGYGLQWVNLYMNNEIPVYDIKYISEFRQENILVSRFAPYYASHKNLHESHRHSFFHALLFTEGKGTHSIDFETFTIKPFQIYFMAPGQVHNWNFDGHVDGYVINFSPEFFQSFLLRPDFIEDFSFFRGVASDSVIQIPKELHKKATAIFEEILKESTGNKGFELTMVKLLMMELFVLISRLSNHPDVAQTSSYNYTLLKSFQKLIDINYKILKLPKEYAELLYITPNHLNALCNDLLGIPAGEVIRNRVILEAKRLLINPDMAISEIADTLNFTDNSYFTKSFKRHVGQTPEEFRKQH
jgi:AraC family transcriptional activator of pobA